jgi:fumarate reductase subunit D
MREYRNIKVNSQEQFAWHLLGSEGLELLVVASLIHLIIIDDFVTCHRIRKILQPYKISRPHLNNILYNGSFITGILKVSIFILSMTC